MEFTIKTQYLWYCLDVLLVSGGLYILRGRLRQLASLKQWFVDRKERKARVARDWQAARDRARVDREVRRTEAQRTEHERQERKEQEERKKFESNLPGIWLDIYKACNDAGWFTLMETIVVKFALKNDPSNPNIPALPPLGAQQLIDKIVPPKNDWSDKKSEIVRRLANVLSPFVVKTYNEQASPTTKCQAKEPIVPGWPSFMKPQGPPIQPDKFAVLKEMINNKPDYHAALNQVMTFINPINKNIDTKYTYRGNNQC